MRSGHDFIPTMASLPSLPLRRLDWDEIKVSPALRARLLDWVDDYEHATSGGSEEEFVAEGHELARLLSEELGWQVAYSE